MHYVQIVGLIILMGQVVLHLKNDFYFCFIYKTKMLKFLICISANILILTQIVESTHFNIRKRELSKNENIIPCNKGTNGTSCVCPNQNCLKYSNKTNGCHPIDCWKWNQVTQTCEQDGVSIIGPIVLQAIPFTGYFGSGFGNMKRWDIFGMYWIVIGSGCFLSCCCACIGRHTLGGETSDEKDAGMKMGSKCGNCLLTTALTVMWIWGIVVIANKEIDAPYVDWEGNDIMCPLI